MRGTDSGRKKGASVILYAQIPLDNLRSGAQEGCSAVADRVTDSHKGWWRKSFLSILSLHSAREALTFYLVVLAAPAR